MAGKGRGRVISVLNGIFQNISTLLDGTELEIDSISGACSEVLLDLCDMEQN
jgi:hypothetical protein